MKETGGKSVSRSWAYQARCIGSCEHDNVGTCHIGLVRQDGCVGKIEVRDANFRDPRNEEDLFIHHKMHTNVAPFVINDTRQSSQRKFNAKVVFVFFEVALYIGNWNRDCIDQSGSF